MTVFEIALEAAQWVTVRDQLHWMQQASEGRCDKVQQWLIQATPLLNIASKSLPPVNLIFNLCLSLSVHGKLSVHSAVCTLPRKLRRQDYASSSLEQYNQWATRLIMISDLDAQVGYTTRKADVCVRFLLTWSRISYMIRFGYIYRMKWHKRHPKFSRAILGFLFRILSMVENFRSAVLATC